MLQRVPSFALETNFFQKNSGSIPRMHVSPVKHSYGSVTGGRTDRQTDDGQSDPYVLLCFAGDTIIQPSKSGQGQTVNDVIRIQRLHQSRNHRRFLLLFSIRYHLFNKIQRNSNSKVYVLSYDAKI